MPVRPGSIERRCDGGQDQAEPLMVKGTAVLDAMIADIAIRRRAAGSTSAFRHQAEALNQLAFDDEVLNRVGSRVRERGGYDREDLLTVGMWKSPRATPGNGVERSGVDA
jgi:hypothetical protein